MRYVRSYAGWGLAVAAIALSPVVLIFALPLAIGAGLDIFGRAGEGPVALALCGPVAVMLLGRALSHTPLRRAAAALAPALTHLRSPARQH
jgi:hypothetical protein